MADQIIGQLVPLCPQALDGTREIGGVPQDNGTDHQVEAGGAESLALKGAVADFAALVEEHRPGQLVAGFALVQPDPAAITQFRA